MIDGGGDYVVVMCCDGGVGMVCVGSVYDDMKCCYGVFFFVGLVLIGSLVILSWLVC